MFQEILKWKKKLFLFHFFWSKSLIKNNSFLEGEVIWSVASELKQDVAFA